MKKIGSFYRRRPYVFSFYLKSFGEPVDLTRSFPCMTHAFYCDSLSSVRSRVQKLLVIYSSLGIDMEAYLEDSLDVVNVDSIIQHYNTQLNLDF